MKVQNTRYTESFTCRSGICGAFAGLIACLVGLSTGRADLSDYQGAVTAESSLISYYTFDASDAADTHGTNNGTLAGTTSFATGVKDSGMALSLGGAGHVNLGFVEAFTFPDQTGTVEAWVKAGNLPENGCVFANRDGFFESRWDVNMNQNKLAIGNWNGGVYETVAIPNASTNWHHLVVVFEDLPDDYYFTVYWDGVAMGTNAQTMAFYFDRPTQIGSISPWEGAPEHWVGEIDEVAFYADPLTPGDILAHYQAIFIGDPPVITEQPHGGAYIEGVNLTLSVKATGPDLSYQWYKGAGPLGGETDPTLTLSNLSSGDAGTYSVAVSNETAVVTSSPAVVNVEPLPAPLVNYQTAVSNEASLVSYYTFDRLVPEDAHGPHDGTLAGSTAWAEGVGGGSAQGLLLDGSGHVDLGSVPDFDFASGVGTVEAWIRADWVPNSVGYWPCLYANRNGGPTVWSLHLSDSKNTPSFYNGSGSSWFVLPGGAGTDWHHFATVFTNGTASFYVDGTLILYSPMARTLGSGVGTTVQLGSASSSSTFEGWIGMLDEVAFYADALPVSSIQAHYNAFVAGEPPVITGQPVGGYYLVGQQAQLSVAASGALLSYQWYKDNALIPGATNALIGPVILTKDFEGDYHVAVANVSGAVTSEVAVVRVDNNIAQYQAAVLSESSLLSYYTFDAGNPQDSMNAHPGTHANTVAYGPGAGGVSNLSLTLDGTGHVDLGQVADFDFTDGTGTVEGWIRPGWTNPAPYDPVMFANRGASNSAWSVQVGQWKTAIGNLTTADGLSQLPIFSDGYWHHYAIVFSSGSVSMYWDGQPEGSFNQTLDSSLALTTQIGSSTPATTTDGWLGGLDEVAFYSDALAAETIWNHYLAMVGTTPPPKLGYAVDGTLLTLSWPISSTGFTLESAGALPGISWIPVAGVVSNQVTVDTSSGTQYYRLRQ